MKIRNAALAAAGLLFGALTSFAQITSLEGYVKGADGKPVEKAVVDITRTDIKGHYVCKSDKKGHYIYTGLPIGTYNLSLQVDGKEVDSIKGVKSHPGDPVENDFDLSKVAQTKTSQKELQQQALATGQIPKELDKSLTPEQRAAMQKQIEESASRMKKNAALNKAYGDGTTAMEAKNYDDAVKNFTEASTLDATQIAVWNSLAGAYLARAKTKTGADFDADTQKGIESYQKSLELKPDDAGIHNNLALALAQAKKLPEAQAELEKAVALDPSSACKYYFNLGALEANAHQDDAATLAFQKAIAGDAGCAEAYYQLGNALMMKATTKPDGTVEPFPGTVEAFQKYLQVAPTGPNAESAKLMIAAMGSKVETNYVDPNAKKTTKKKQ
jgi:tetratricopeptide (TPR) repeat protein